MSAPAYSRRDMLTIMWHFCTELYSIPGVGTQEEGAVVKCRERKGVEVVAGKKTKESNKGRGERGYECWEVKKHVGLISRGFPRWVGRKEAWSRSWRRVTVDGVTG